MKRVKHESWDYQQYQAGHKKVTLTDHGQTASNGFQSGTSSQTGKSESTSSNLSRTLRMAAAHAERAASSSTNANGTTNGSSQSLGSNRSNSISSGRSITWKTTLVPQMAWRRVLRSLQFYSPSDTREEIASEVASLETGYAKLYITGRGVADVKFPMITNPFRLSPQFGAKKSECHLAHILRQPTFQDPELLQIYQKTFFEALRTYLNELHASQQPDRSALEAIAHNLPEIPTTPRTIDNNGLSQEFN